MTTHIAPTRRDERHTLRHGSSFLEFLDPLHEGPRLRAVLVRVSSSGLAFRLERPRADLLPEARLSDVTVRVGECALRGDVVIRNVSPADDGSREYGCLFYPESGESEGRWMALIAGVENSGSGDGGGE